MIKNLLRRAFPARRIPPPALRPQPPPAVSEPAFEPDRFDHYRLDRAADGSFVELGRGPLGVTYRAVDVNLRCQVALKVIDAAVFPDDTLRKRFVSEARAAARLRHPNVAALHHLGRRGEEIFYAAEFIEGETLEALVQRSGPLPPLDALRLALQVTGAMEAAASEGLVHRNLKPANLMIVGHGEHEHEPSVKVIDFGLANSAPAGSELPSVPTSSLASAAEFTSPEQSDGREPDIRSAIYSLGCTLWYALAGVPPFTLALTSIAEQHLHSEPPWEQLRGTPKPVRRLLATMLRKDPALRPQSPADLQDQIERCVAALSRSRLGAAAAPFVAMREQFAAHPLAAFAAAAVLVAMAFVGAVSLLRMESKPKIIGVANPEPSGTSASPGVRITTNSVANSPDDAAAPEPQAEEPAANQPRSAAVAAHEDDVAPAPAMTPLPPPMPPEAAPVERVIAATTPSESPLRQSAEVEHAIAEQEPRPTPPPSVAAAAAPRPLVASVSVSQTPQPIAATSSSAQRETEAVQSQPQSTSTAAPVVSAPAESAPIVPTNRPLLTPIPSPESASAAATPTVRRRAPGRRIAGRRDQ